MATRGILDSSPIQPPKRAVAPVSKNLKRSASVASLPTPPRTIRKRSRSRGSAYQSSDDEGALPVLSPHGHEAADENAAFGHKRRRIDRVVDELSHEDREEAFWLAAPPLPAEPKAKARAPTSAKPSRLPRPKGAVRTSQSTATSSASTSRARMPSTRPSLTSSRRLSQSRAATVHPNFALPSPPPSRVRPPVTPPRRTRAKAKPVRDSPNNPFIEGSPPSSPVGPNTPIVEKEMLTYVFRGKRQLFPNPHFNAPRDPRSFLAPEHPDFEPTDDCTPRRLFAAPPIPMKRSTKPLTPHRRALSPESENEAEEEADLDSGGLPRGNLAGEFARIRELEKGASGRKGKEVPRVPLKKVVEEDDDDDLDEYVFVDKEEAKEAVVEKMPTATKFAVGRS
ncbi:hypothetical protein FA95DRAFT_1561813 [Auriscalpium vulgare]|uniref:Uncharacterized protein n=1 Tax=Auriscalpium vulgare TaxID=40419 RepID=A0ACB8RLE3_9AGAM|nr:hypothetical protein FA95DRAFT_1561813 [Auriscalpium vulgare]